jgi:histidinol-phosphate aminotransferase
LIDPKRLAREAVRDLPSYKTGVSPRLLEALASGRTVARLASNENLYGPSPRVYDAIRSASDVNLYPDGANTSLREALAAHTGVDADRILVSTGSENVLSALVQGVLSPGDRVVHLEPTFLLAFILCGASGAECVRVSYGDDLEFSVDALAEQAGRSAKLLYLSNPNNPTGNAFSPTELEIIVSAMSPDSLVVVDEAYYEYASRHERFESSLAVLEKCGRPYVVLRTFSKAYGLAGLRVGYGIFYHPELVSITRRASTIFDVGSVSQRAALAALEDQAHMEETVGRTLAEKKRLQAALEERELRTFPSFANFVSLWFRDRDDAMKLESELAHRSVFVKALPGRGGEGLVRVTIGRPNENEMFLQALGPSLSRLGLG